MKSDAILKIISRSPGKPGRAELLEMIERSYYGEQIRDF